MIMGDGVLGSPARLRPTEVDAERVRPVFDRSAGFWSRGDCLELMLALLVLLFFGSLDMLLRYHGLGEYRVGASLLSGCEGSRWAT